MKKNILAFADEKTNLIDFKKQYVVLLCLDSF